MIGSKAHRTVEGWKAGRGARIAAVRAAVLTATVAWAGAAKAQNIPTYFPSGNAGFDQQLGVTVMSRSRPLYATPGIAVGGFVIRPNVDAGVLYNSNVNGIAGSGSWGTRTAASLAANSNWLRNSLSLSVGASHSQFFSFPSEGYTDWNVGVGGGYTIDRSLLGVAYSHQTSYALGSTIGATRTQTPTLDQTDSAQISYTFNYYDLAITPSMSASAYRYGMSTVLGQALNQQFLDRNVIAAGLSSRYSLSDEGGLLLVVRGVSSRFVHSTPEQFSNNSTSLQVLSGLDYQAEGPWRYRLLAGVEVRSFQASQYASRIAPIIEAGVIWTPTGLTTLTGTLSREIEDPQSAGTNGFVATKASLVIDHELLPNLFLQGRVNGETIAFLQGGGQQTQISAGAGATWLLSRNVRLTLDYDYVSQTGGSNAATISNPATLTTAPFRQSVIGLALHFAL